MLFGSRLHLSLKQHFHLLCYFSSLSTTSITAPLISPALLNQCKSIFQANLIHQQAVIQDLLTHLSINLISTYLSLNAPSHALSLLQRLPPSPFAVFWWNSLIRHAIGHGLLHYALSLFRSMLRLGWSPDHYTLPFVLKASGELPSFLCGSSFHAFVCSRGFESNVFVCNAVVAMYGRCGALDYAHQMFDEMCKSEIFDLISWNSMVSAYMRNGDLKGALGLFRRMGKVGDTDIQPDAVSLVNVLPACASMGAWLCGKELHGFAMRSGLFEDVFVANSLVDMYAKCGMMHHANKVFERMQKKDVVSWNAMVTGYSQIGSFEDALGLFKKMRAENIELDVVSWSALIAGYAQRELGYEALDVFRQMLVFGSKPNEVTLASLLSGCASVGALLHGKATHCYAIKRILIVDRCDPTAELLVLNAIIDMYTKCKSINMARTIFDSLPTKYRNVVTWTAMIGGYAQHGEANVALELFSQMVKQDRSAKPNAYTISCALMACARLAALRSGRQIHAYAIRNHYDFDVLFVANCLIDMYCKCGDIYVARVVFNNMKHRNAVSWTSLISGYGMHGHGEEASEVFHEMRREGLAPDSVTFLAVLYACSHSGMVEEGTKHFNSMNLEFGVIPGEEHYACMVDLLGRAGRLDEAMTLIEGMPTEAGPVVWVALLSGCRKYANVELGEFAANKLLELNYEIDGSYTLLSNIYASAKRWKDVSKIRSLMKRLGIRKRPGCSWVQGKKGTATFFVGDRKHPQSKQIYEILTELIRRIKLLGYVPETSFALHDVDDEEKGNLLFEQ